MKADPRSGVKSAAQRVLDARAVYRDHLAACPVCWNSKHCDRGDAMKTEVAEAEAWFEEEHLLAHARGLG